MQDERTHEAEIRRMLDQRLSPRAIAAILGVSEEAVRRVRDVRPDARRADPAFDWWLAERGK